ncbi:MAG: hypothetical protein R3B99_07635 [Polyangiales bacterium]
MESAVGLFWENDSSFYDPNNGPRLVGAKLNRVDERSPGEGISGFNPPFLPPNDERVLYDEGDFRLRIAHQRRLLHDSVTAVRRRISRPSSASTRGADGSNVLLRVGETYEVMGGSLRVWASPAGRREGGDVVYDRLLRRPATTTST